jgi:hypothetical protein
MLYIHKDEVLEVLGGYFSSGLRIKWFPLSSNERGITHFTLPDEQVSEQREIVKALNLLLRP